MSYAAKSLAVVAAGIASASTKLSIAAVLGVTALPLLPQNVASTAPAAVEVVRAKPVPLIESEQPDATFQLAARRTRPKRERALEPGDDVDPPPRKTSAISQPEPPASAPIGPSQGTPETALAEPPKPDAWSDAAVIAALRECVKLLAPIAADVEVSPPVKTDECGAPAAVLLRRVGSGANRVEINPPAMLNCAMAATLHTWVEKTLQPAAQASLGAPIARLRNASGYVCRKRNGSPFHNDKLSEHALANAIDIAGFVTADGRSIDVARFWGPTRRDAREAERVAAARAEAGKAEPEKADASKRDAVPRDRKISAIAPAAAISAKATDRDSPAVRAAELRKLGRGASDISADRKATPTTGPAEREAFEKSAEAAFLRQLHKGACGIFGTVLGPEANEAHRDHFHFDLVHRRHKAFCE